MWLLDFCVSPSRRRRLGLHGVIVSFSGHTHLRFDRRGIPLDQVKMWTRSERGYIAIKFVMEGNVFSLLFQLEIKFEDLHKLEIWPNRTIRLLVTCVPIEDSDKPVHPHSLIRVFATPFKERC